MNDSDFSYQIIKPLGELSRAGDYTVEANIISFCAGPPKFDIRKWDRRSNKMLKGIALTPEEREKLKEILNSL